ncbi:cytochrome P450 2K1-like isoform X3 [Engystomops pustulosus]|uniref:cytochrome P450 2K1-like isoform X3 n=1 Tax=Engystomops pustulosus TaxID=76066 RepID=UPI003AFB5620
MRRTDFAVTMSEADSISILLAVTAFCLLAKLFYDLHKNKHKNFPPGPMWLPIIGSMYMFDAKKPYLTMEHLSKKYGSIFSFQMGQKKIVVLCGYDVVKEALIKHGDEFCDRPHVPLFADLTRGYGIVFSNDENWNVIRRFTFTALRQLGVGSKVIENVVNEECDMLVTSIKSQEGQAFDILPVLSTAVTNILIHIILGPEYNCEDPTILRAKHLIEEGVKLTACPTSLVKSKSGLYFHNENLNMVVNNLLIGGMEPVHSTLRWGLLLMMKYPDIQEKVQNEIDKVIGFSQPQIEHRKEMPFTNAVIHEIQRFGNIAPIGIPRATTRDIAFKGYFLPKGTFVIMLMKTVLQDKNYFEKPEEFYPQHFLDSDGNFMINEAFIPFSAGKRSCIGENLAKIQLFLFFTRLLQNFTFLPCPGVDLDFTPEIGFVSSPKPYTMRAVPRSQTD